MMHRVRKQIRLRHQQIREEIAAELKPNYAPMGILEVYWDGKLLPAAQGKLLLTAYT